MLHVWTANIGYPGPHRLDVTRKSGGMFGSLFAPSWGLLKSTHPALGGTLPWEEYAKRYTQEMRASYAEHRSEWDTLLAAQWAVLVCYCREPTTCHRSLLSGILGKLGARVYGEITEWDRTVESPCWPIKPLGEWGEVL